MSETQIRNSIIAWVSWKGGFIFIHDSVGIYDPIAKCFRKRQGINRKLGVSDLLGIWKEKFLAIEVKSAKGQLTMHQEIFLRDVNMRGGIGMVARCVEDVENELKRRGLY